jgi:hypothetical protein
MKIVNYIISCVLLVFGFIIYNIADAKEDKLDKIDGKIVAAITFIIALGTCPTLKDE